MRTHLEIKRIELWSLFKIAFVLYAVLGLIAGLFYAFFMLAAGAFQDYLIGEEFADFGFFGGVFSLFLIPVIALFYGAIGSVFITICGVFFNLIAGLVGGLRLETEVDVAEQEPVLQPPDAEETGPTI